MSEKPKNKKTRPQMPYWMPITLWSVEKMYFRHHPARDARVRSDVRPGRGVPPWREEKWKRPLGKITLTISKENGSLQSPKFLICHPEPSEGPHKDTAGHTSSPPRITMFDSHTNPPPRADVDLAERSLRPQLDCVKRARSVQRCEQMCAISLRVSSGCCRSK